MITVDQLPIKVEVCATGFVRWPEGKGPTKVKEPKE